MSETSWESELKKRTGWSDKIVEAIRNEEEANIYLEAGLKESKVDGKPALIQPHIDPDKIVPEWVVEQLGESWRGWSNSDLMGEGYPPRDENGDPYELHHIGQDPFSPLAELTWYQHREGGNSAILHTHDDTKIDREYFAKEVKKKHWMARFEDYRVK